MRDKGPLAAMVALCLLLALAACGRTDREPTPIPTLLPATAVTALVPDATSTPILPAPTAGMAPASTSQPPPASVATPTATSGRPATAVRPGTTSIPAPAPTSTASPPPSPAVSPAPTHTASPAPTLAPTALPGGDPAAVVVELQRVTGGLDTPVGIAAAGDGSGRLFIVEKPGRIRIVQDGAPVGSAFLDITGRVRSSGSEQGLLGLAFHPDYAENGFFFVNYTDAQGDTVLSRFTVGPDPVRADPAGEVVLLTVDQPAANHNGGHLAFGPDGYLYIGLGDGGGADDRYGNGQNPLALLGKMLRIDVDGAAPYAIPPGNPFVDDPGVRDEIWAFGLRNPWRFSFDRLTGDLYIADVGQNLYEEVNVRPAAGRGGENYGWPIMEATHCFPEDRPCRQDGLTLPVVEYDHGQGCSVTGGYVYRGRDFPLLAGIYLYADYCSGTVWGAARQADGTWRVAELARVDARISSFGEGGAGELFAVDMSRGELLRVTAAAR